jgi:hypothetical protein
MFGQPSARSVLWAVVGLTFLGIVCSAAVVIFAPAELARNYVLVLLGFGGPIGGAMLFVLEFVNRIDHKLDHNSSVMKALISAIIKDDKEQARRLLDLEWHTIEPPHPDKPPPKP